MTLDRDEIDRIVERALAEDLGVGDVTSSAVIPAAARLAAVAAAREPLVLAGLAVAEAVFRRLAPDCRIAARAEDGDALGVGDIVAEIAGPARGLLSAERTALNILQHLSGIATLTRRYVDAISGTGAVLLDTRKTVPGLRVLAKYATAVGGARNHRKGLYDGVLIKDNHVAVCGGVAEAVAKARAYTDLPVEVECDRLDQVRDAVAAGADMILLDNMDTATLREAVALVAGRAKLEASGGVTLETIRAIAETGVDFISVGRITQSAAAVDIGLDYIGVPRT
ncbi:MAG: carboxylating nicotinate-nucleotide diphosphorylase [Alphaproteobacteria bacterium]